jgi:hypothetical protein
MSSMVAEWGMGVVVASFSTAVTFITMRLAAAPESEPNSDVASSALEGIPPNNIKTNINAIIGIFMVTILSLPYRESKAKQLPKIHSILKKNNL